MGHRTAAIMRRHSDDHDFRRPIDKE